jgi:AraC family transcriptional regulator
MLRIEEHVRAHLADAIHLASLAEIANMSVDHFLRSFRAATGTTPYQYILGLRLAKASTMLRETVVPIATIATQCGFHGASHFSVAFSDRFGTRPSQYRRSG